MTVKVDDDAREVLTMEAAAVRDTIADPAARDTYLALAAAVADGEVDDTLVPSLERLLDLGLRTGRVRHVHGPHAEAAVTRVFDATPAGQSLASALAQVNHALGALRGQPLDRLRFAARGPGRFTLAIETPAAGLTLDIGPAGVAVKDVSVGA
ncbi:MAG TPA: hypothetical protein VFM14_02665 [Gemmatimonadales bacterium]|nr:hypothetical protein [Gemmatimonadales bacterium]